MICATRSLNCFCFDFHISAEQFYDRSKQELIKTGGKNIINKQCHVKYEIMAQLSKLQIGLIEIKLYLTDGLNLKIKEESLSFLNSTVAFKMVGKTFKKPAMSVPKQPASLVYFEKLENGKILHEIVSGYYKQELSPERVHFSFICAYEKVF